MPAPTDSNLKSVKNHPRYYIPGGDVIVIVDDIAFSISSYFLTRESSDFRERLSPPPSSDSKQKPTIVIQAKENVTPEDFAKLCWVFYNPQYSIYDAPLDTWETILRLANQYKFAEVKDLAFRQLQVPDKFPLTLVNRIVLYRKHNADRKYLQQLYVDLLSRPEALTIEEGSALGMTSALIISGARERLRAMSERLSLFDPLPESMKKITEEMVVSIFWDGPLPDLSRLNASTTGNTKPTTNGTTSSSYFSSTSTSTTSNPTADLSKSTINAASDGLFQNGKNPKGRK